MELQSNEKRMKHRVCYQTEIISRKHNSEYEETINTVHLHRKDSLYHSVSHSLFFPAHILIDFGFLTSIKQPTVIFHMMLFFTFLILDL